ncbi:hypothetical protein BDZ97DRAFT_1907691 [Flammula alnicola]|nr:hypothetical protein BDZ97DRAFT_1907691 [Flammula alnicola]
MDIDPLSDTVPPRYAIESDEEEDEVNPLGVKSPQPEDVKIEVKILGGITPGKCLAIASGDAGNFWAKGADLGEQTASVLVNGVQVGLVFNPKWTQSNVIISEVLSKLPLYAMHPYATNILESVKPKSVSLLDSYPFPTYASDTTTAFHEAPLRYLSTSENTEFLDKEAELYSPPNLLQSTSASFLSILGISDVPGTLVLLPSPHIPQPSPKQISPSNFSHLAQDDVEWPAHLVNTAQKLVFHALGESTTRSWQPRDGGTKEKPPKRTTEIGEGGMYI